MRASLSEIELIQQYLCRSMSPEDKLLFEARLCIDETLLHNLQAQRKLQQLVIAQGRQQFRESLDRVYTELMTESKNNPFRKWILNLFKPT